jgi:hypothetical protein
MVATCSAIDAEARSSSATCRDKTTEPMGFSAPKVCENDWL